MAYIGQVTAAGNTSMPVAQTLYGTCSTAAATAAKVVTCAAFDTTCNVTGGGTTPEGTTIAVYMQYSNTVANPTLNVNSKGACPIYRCGSLSVGKTHGTSWEAGSIVQFTYNKTLKSTGCWVISGQSNSNDDVFYEYGNSRSGVVPGEHAGGVLYGLGDFWPVNAADGTLVANNSSFDYDYANSDYSIYTFPLFSTVPTATGFGSTHGMATPDKLYYVYNNGDLGGDSLRGGNGDVHFRFSYANDPVLLWGDWRVLHKFDEQFADYMFGLCPVSEYFENWMGSAGLFDIQVASAPSAAGTALERVYVFCTVVDPDICIAEFHGLATLTAATANNITSEYFILPFGWSDGEYLYFDPDFSRILLRDGSGGVEDFVVALIGQRASNSYATTINRGLVKLPTTTTYTFASSGWNSSTKIHSGLNSTYPFANYDVEVFPCASTTSAMMEAWAAAQVVGSAATSNQVKALGTVPTINITMGIRVWPKS